jgi:hypothetical protein
MDRNIINRSKLYTRLINANTYSRYYDRQDLYQLLALVLNDRSPKVLSYYIQPDSSLTDLITTINRYLTD